MSRTIKYSLNGQSTDLIVEIMLSYQVKIPEPAINKALMIAMNYLLENMETTEHEEPE
jgi:hypothetical protein